MTHINCRNNYKILEDHFGKDYLLQSPNKQKKQPVKKITLDPRLFRKQKEPELVTWLYDKEFTAFTTFTTQKPIGLPATRRLAERFAKRFHAGFAIDFFWCAEQFDTREGFHFHGLIKEGCYYTEEDYRRYWESKKFYKDLAGRTRVSMNYGRFDYQLINRTKTIEFYVTKYITKKLTDYDYHFRKPIY